MRRLSFILAVAVMLLAATVASANAHGDGNSPAQLGAAGWACENVPGLGVHCFPPGTQVDASAIAVKVYDTSDPDAEHAPFLGTEILIHADIYEQGMQPCPQEGLEHYVDLRATSDPIPYYACHHYAS